jgi:hypothetical protein
MEGLLQNLGGVLRLAAVTLQALLRFKTATLSGFGLFFRVSLRGRYSALLCVVWVLCGCTRDTWPRVFVSVQCPLRPVLPLLPISFVSHMRYKCVQMVFSIPTPSVAHRIGLGRVGDDF